MPEHVQRLGAFAVTFGVVTTTLALAILVYFGGFAPLWSWAESLGGLGLPITASVLGHLLLGLPVALAGIFIRRSAG